MPPQVLSFQQSYWWGRRLLAVRVKPNITGEHGRRINWLLSINVAHFVNNRLQRVLKQQRYKFFSLLVLPKANAFDLEAQHYALRVMFQKAV